ncbi:hypothetical protein [Maribacter sp. 2307UL18-2]|uniref:hypothetical protein n=1 Tax=Maribacter sp. 2307UL18-2 TaxID=3386274 RepID=UPI0039BCA59E
MDIIAQKEGLIYIESDAGKINDVLSTDVKVPYFIEIPITFTDVDNGPKTISNVSINNILIDKESYASVSNPSFHSYKKVFGKKNISGDNMGDSFDLKDDEAQNKNAILVIKFLFDDSENSIEKLKQNQGQIDFKIDLSIDFIDTQRLDLTYSGTIVNISAGKISNPNINRKGSIFLTQINLISLFVFIGLLSVWNYGLNKSIYLESSGFFSHDFFTTAIAILATFLGLSLRKLKSFLAVFTKTFSFFKFPELHLSLEQFRGLSSKQWSFMLIGLALLSGYIIYSNWSYEITLVNSDFHIYDNKKGTIIDLTENKRIYRKHLKDSSRFKIISKIEASEDNNLWIGKVVQDGFWGKPSMMMDSIGIFVGDGTQAGIRLNKKDTYLKLIENNDLINEKIPVERIFSEAPGDIENYSLKYFPPNSKEVETVWVNDYIRLSKNEIENLKRNFAEVIEGNNYKNYMDVYKDRKKLRQQFEDILNKQFSNRSKIDAGILTSLISNYLDDIKGDRKKAIENISIISALWRIGNNHKIGPFDYEKIKSICQDSYDIYERNEYWPVARASVEFLMILQKGLPNDISDAPINTIRNNFIELDQHNFNLVDLIFVSSSLGLIENSIIQDYITNNLAKITSRFNNETNMYNALVLMDQGNGRQKDDYLHNDGNTLDELMRFCNKPNIKTNYEKLQKPANSS